MVDFSGTPVLRLMTINTLCKLPAEQRWKELAAWVAAERPDVICLQECRRENGRDVSSWLASSLPGAWSVAFAGAEGPDGYLSGNAVLSRWPFEHEGQSRLGCEDAWPKMLLHVRTAGLDIYCVHLTAALDGAAVREAQVLAIDDFIRATADPRSALPPVLGGTSTPPHGLRLSLSSGANPRWAGARPSTRMPGRSQETAMALPGTTPTRSPRLHTATTRAVITCSSEPRKSPSAGPREPVRTLPPPDR